MTKGFLINALKYVLALGLLTYVVWSNWGRPEDGKGLAYVWQRHFVEGQPVNYGSLVVAMTFMASGVLCTIVRWYFLVRAVGLSFRFADALRLGMIGFFFSNLLPGGVGGDLVKAVFIAREQDRRAIAVSTILIDRVFAVWGICWFVALLGVLFWWGGHLEVAGEKGLKTIVTVAVAIVVASLIGWGLIGLLTPEGAERFEKRLELKVGRRAAQLGGIVCLLLVAVRLMRRERVEKVKEHIESHVGHAIAQFWTAIWMYRQQPRVVAFTIVLTFIGFIGFTLCFHFAARVLWDGAQGIPGVREHFLVVPIGLLIQGVPLLPGGAGLAEFGFGALYKLLGYDMAPGIVATLVQRIAQLLLGMTGLYLYLGMRPALKQAPEPEAEPALSASGE